MIGVMILFTLAGAVSSIWLGTVVLYISSTMGWEGVLTLPPTELALYLAATFGPLAALWLIIGFFYIASQGQRQEQVLQTLASQARRNAEQTEAQVRTLIEMQAESRRRSMLGGMDLVIKDMNGQAALLAERLGMVSEPEADGLWARTVSGDLWAFAHAFLIRAAAYPDFADMLAERLAGDTVCSGALQTFLRRYDQLSDGFRENEADRLMRQVLEDGPLARLQVLFADVNARAVRLRMEWAAPTGTWAEPEPAGLADQAEVYPVPEFHPPSGAVGAAASRRAAESPQVDQAPLSQDTVHLSAGVAAIAAAAAGLAVERPTADLPDIPDGFGDENQGAANAAPDLRGPEDTARDLLRQFRQKEDPAPQAAETGADPDLPPVAEDGAPLHASMSRLNDALRRLNGDAAADGAASRPAAQGDLLSTLPDPAADPARGDDAASKS